MKLDMRCRVPGCKKKSKGPRFHYMCEDHKKLSKREKLAFLKSWKEKHPSRHRPAAEMKQQAVAADMISAIHEKSKMSGKKATTMVTKLVSQHVPFDIVVHVRP